MRAATVLLLRICVYVYTYIYICIYIHLFALHMLFGDIDEPCMICICIWYTSISGSKVYRVPAWIRWSCPDLGRTLGETVVSRKCLYIYYIYSIYIYIYTVLKGPKKGSNNRFGTSINTVKNNLFCTLPCWQCHIWTASKGSSAPPMMASTGILRAVKRTYASRVSLQHVTQPRGRLPLGFSDVPTSGWIMLDANMTCYLALVEEKD